MNLQSSWIGDIEMQRWLKACKKVMNIKNTGSISLLASICLAAVLTLEAILLPAGFLRYFEAQVPDYVNMQLQTVLASYNREMFKRYALLAFTASEARTTELNGLFGERAKSYNFQAEIKVKERLKEPDILHKSVLNYMKPRLPLAAFKAIAKRFTEFKQCLDASKKDLVQIGKDADSVQDKLHTLKQVTTKNQEDSKLKRLFALGLDKALDYCFDGYSQFKELKRRSNVQIETVASFANIFNTAQALLQHLEEIQLPLLDDVLLNEYLIAFLSSGVRNQKQKIPASNRISNNLTGRKQEFQSLKFSSPYELEACMSFFNGHAAYLQVQTEIFALRFALQFAAIWQNKTQQATFRTIATLISLACALFGFTVPPEAVQHFLTAVMAGIRSFQDLQVLQAGKMLPLLPTTLAETANLSKKLADFQHDYFDYARLFLLLTKREHRLVQLYNAISKNIPGDYYCTALIKSKWCAPKGIYKESNYQSKLSYLSSSMPDVTKLKSRMEGAD